jgi:hypothetical protein
VLLDRFDLFLRFIDIENELSKIGYSRNAEPLRKENP